CARVALFFCFFFQAEDGIRDDLVTGVQTCALPILAAQRWVLCLGLLVVVPGRALWALIPGGQLGDADCLAEWRVTSRGLGPSREIGRASWRERGESEVGGDVTAERRGLDA